MQASLSLYSQVMMQAKIRRAKERAKEKDATFFVVSLDNGENRTLTTASREYVDSDEFSAFDGEILASVSPDGLIEYF